MRAFNESKRKCNIEGPSSRFRSLKELFRKSNFEDLKIHKNYFENPHFKTFQNYFENPRLKVFKKYFETPRLKVFKNPRLKTFKKILRKSMFEGFQKSTWFSKIF